MKTILLGIIFLLSLGSAAKSQQYSCGFSAKLSYDGGTSTDPNTQVLSRHDFLAMVAATDGRSLDPTTLKLIFDVQARQFQVVQKSDGSLVAVVYTVTNEQRVPLDSGGSLGVSVDALEQAALLEPGASTAAGTIAGLYIDIESYLYPTQDVYRFVSWKADFSTLSQTGGVFSAGGPGFGAFGATHYVHEPMLIQGKFSVNGKQFVPTGK